MKPFVAASLSLVVAGAASAASVSFTFNVEVESAFETAPGLLATTAFSSAAVGDTGTVTWTWDDTAPDFSAAPEAGEYYGLLSAMTLTIGAQSYSFVPGDSRALIFDNDGSEDYMQVVATDFGGGDAIIGFAQFVDPTQTAISSDALPATLDHNSFLGPGTGFDWILDTGNDGTPDAQIDLKFIDGPVIPLPSAAGLGFAGLAILGARRRR